MTPTGLTEEKKDTIFVKYTTGMKLKFIDVNTSRLKPKATIHLSGKLGFNNEAISYMNLAARKAYKLAVDEENENLYLLETEDDGAAAKVAKAGEYYYLNVGDAFERLGLDYKNNTIIFDIREDRHEGNPLFVLTKRVIPRKKD